MRSRSRDRRPFESRVRERDVDRRERSLDRNVRHGDRNLGYRGVKRSPSRSRSRSRDKMRSRDRDRMNDSSREFREVKRILSSVGGDDRSNRDRSRIQQSDKGRDDLDHVGRKKNYGEYTDNIRNDDDRKAVKKMRTEGEFSTDKVDTHKENKEKNGVANKTEVDDEQYDDKALSEIEAFLNKTSKAVDAQQTSTKVDKQATAGSKGNQTKGDTKTDTTTAKNKGAAPDGEGSDEDVDVAVLWEDEEEVARREALAAEERRKKRLEIASKYAAATTTATNTTAAAAAAAGGISAPTSPKGSAKGRSASDVDVMSPKVGVAVVDAAAMATAQDSSSSNNTHGSSSISVPTTSLHLAKLALDEESNAAAAVAAATSRAAERSGTPAAAEGEPALAPVPVSEVVVDPEQAQLEMEKAALELEERRERGLLPPKTKSSSAATTGTGGTGGTGGGGYGGYGAGGRFEFDMFSASPSGIEEQQQLGGVNGGVAGVGRRVLREALLDGEGLLLGGGGEGQNNNPHLQSNWDDGEGYYKARIGELIGDRFQILGVVGKGVFSTVLKCVDLRAGDGSSHVAIKMIRNNDTMRKAAEKEKSILLSIAEKDPENKRFCVRLITHLEYRHHVALVFEYQSMNLRETLKKFGKDVGINIGAIRMYGRQLFVALKHLMDLRVVHADIKLDNILCSGDLKQIKLCDFGSAFRESDTDNDPTPYLVSRFYRAPEIILGMPYDRAIDLWSVCVCLYELFTGHVMFPGRTNNEMLKLMMAVKGRFPNKQVKAHMRAYEVLQLEPHFDPDLRFRQYEADPISGKTVLRLIDVTSPTRDLAALLRSSKAGADDMKLVSGLTDLLEKGLALDPSKRLTVVEAFRHPFFASNK